MRWRSGLTRAFFRLRIGFCRSETNVPWYAAGRNAAPYCRAPSISGPGPIAMKPGRFWFSVPRPYVTQAPRLGRVATRSPVFISRQPPGWLTSSPTIERITHS